MTPDDFIEQVLYPAFNENPEVTAVDSAFGGTGDANEVLNVTTADGSEWQITVAKRRA